MPETRKKIREKARKYRQNEDLLIVAINVHNRGGFDIRIDAHDTMFGENGVWINSGDSQCARLYGVLFLANTDSYCVSHTKACLYINPFSSADMISDVPEVLLRLPHVKGVNKSEFINGESIPSLLGIL